MNMLKNITAFLSFLTLIMLGGCVKNESYYGYSFPSNYQDLLKINQTSADKVVEILGNPTTTSSFGGTSYFYIHQKQTNVAFLKPTVVEQQILQLTFNQNNILQSINHYTLDNCNHIKFSNDQIELEGSKIGALEQILSNIGKFNKSQKRAPML